MRTVEEVRRLRLLQLKDEYGSYSKLNAKVGRLPTDSTFSQIVNQAADSKTGKPRNMGSAQARELETKLGKPEGWMDTDPESPSALSKTVAQLAAALDALKPEQRDEMAAGFLRIVLIKRGGTDEDQRGVGNA